MNNYVELRPINGRKSFYGKARAIVDGDTITLYSYNTAVCRIVNGKFERLWYDEIDGKQGYSRTTMSHIQAFCDTFGLPIITKKEWDKL